MKTRIVYTKIWDDNYFSELSRFEKIFFLYLISNDSIGLTGAYEVNLKKIAFILGATQQEIDSACEKFTKNGKFIFRDNYVLIVNSKKYQDYSKGSKNQKKAFQREIDLLPESIQELYYSMENLTSSQLVDNQLETSSQLDINKKSEIRNKKLEIRKPEPEIRKLTQKEMDDLFDLFWKMYPKKKGKGKAKESFEKSVKKTDPRIIFEGLKRIIESGEWRDYKFIPFPTTWLNQKRWEDETQVSIKDIEDMHMDDIPI